jgi:epoxyqueuosine reductase
MQRWFYEANPGNLDLKRARDERAKLLSSPMPEVTGEPVERHPEEWNANLAALAEGRTFDMWGVARMDPLWVYEGQYVPQQTIIMLGFAHDYEQIATAPDPTAGVQVIRQYGRAAVAAKLIAGWFPDVLPYAVDENAQQAWRRQAAFLVRRYCI